MPDCPLRMPLAFMWNALCKLSEQPRRALACSTLGMERPRHGSCRCILHLRWVSCIMRRLLLLLSFGFGISFVEVFGLCPRCPEPSKSRTWHLLKSKPKKLQKGSHSVFYLSACSCAHAYECRKDTRPCSVLLQLRFFQLFCIEPSRQHPARPSYSSLQQAVMFRHLNSQLAFGVVPGHEQDEVSLGPRWILMTRMTSIR